MVAVHGLATIRRAGRLALLATIALTVVSGVGPTALVAAHEDIAGSEPEAGAQLDEPISEVTIDFGVEIGEDVEMAMTRDTGEGTFDEIETETTRIAPTVGRMTFDPLDRDGRYFVRYLAPVPADGHVVEGAIFFDLGDVGGGGSTSATPWFAFGAFAVVVLGLGAWLSVRRHRSVGAADGSPVTDPDHDDAADGTADEGSGDLTR